MTVHKCIAALALATAIAVPSSAWALGFGIGCADLPAEARAAGVLQGLSTCDMSVAEARRILGYQGRSAAVSGDAAAAPRVHHRHQLHRPRQDY